MEMFTQRACLMLMAVVVAPLIATHPANASYTLNDLGSAQRYLGINNSGQVVGANSSGIFIYQGGT